MEKRVIVHFRKFMDNSIIAIFPELESNGNKFNCMSFSEGKYHSCDPYSLKAITDVATPDEYELLENELKDMGVKMNVVYKIHPSFHNERIRNIEKRYKENK